MAESKSNIGVVIGGDITPLQQSLNKGKKEIAAFVGDIRTATNDVAKLGAAAGVAAAGGLAAVFKTTSQNVRELKNFAAVSNTTVKEFQKMAFGANQFGISNEKLSNILKDVNERIGDFASEGGGPMADFFEKIAPQLGLTIDHFKTLSGPEALQAYYQALEQANLNQQDMTFYLDSMSGDLTSLIPLLKDNGALLKAMGQEAEDLGAILSDVDVAQIEEANKAFSRAGQVISGVGQAITVELAPYVTEVVNQFVNASKEAGGFGNVVEEHIGKAAKVVGVMADGIHGAQLVFKGLHVAAAGVGTGIVMVFNEIVQSWEFLVVKVTNGVNALSEQLSRIPGIDIDQIGLPTFGAAVEELTQSSINNVQQLAREFHDFAMEPLPSEGIEEFLTNIKQASIEAAQAVANVTTMAPEGQEAGATEDPRIRALKERFLTEEELARQHAETMALIGDEYNAEQFQSEAQWLSVREQAIDEHYRKVQSLRENDRRSAINLTESLGNSLMALSQGHSKKAFEVTKKASIAAATIKGIQAAVDAWQAGMSTGRPDAPLVAASYTAASLAKTAGIINNIKSQSFNGGGSQPSAGGGGIPSVAAGGGVATGQAQPSQQVALNIPEDAIITGRGMIDMMNEAIENGANITLVGDTA